MSTARVLVSHKAFMPALLVLVSAIVFGASLPNPFYYDDLIVLQDNGWLHGLTPRWGWFGTLFVDSDRIFPAYRPVLMLSYFVNAKILGTSPASFRVGNVILHTLNALLLVRLIVSLEKKETSRFLGWCVGFLFLLHPLQTLPINFLWKRSSVLVTTFLLVSCLVHTEQRQKNERTYPVRLLILQPMLFFLAFCTKESGVLLPSFLILIDFLFFRTEFAATQKRSLALYAVLVALAALFTWFRVVVVDQALGIVPLSNRRLLGHWEYFAASLDVIVDYLGLWLFPAPLLMDDPIAAPVFPWASALLVASSLGLSCLAGWYFRSRPLVLFAICVFWVDLAPSVSGLMPLSLIKDQVRLYLPLAGLSCLLVMGIQGGMNRWGLGKYVNVFFVLLVTLYGGFSLAQNIRYRSPLLIWEDVLAQYPDSGLAWEHLGFELENKRLYRAAVAAYEEASRVEPENHAYQVKALQAKFQAGYPRKELAKELAHVSGERVDALQSVNLAILEAELGEYKKAQSILRTILQVYPYYGLAHYTLGVIWDRTGDWENARKAYLNTLKVSPQNIEARNALRQLEKEMETKDLIQKKRRAGPT